jgi:hypothetical protein
MRLGRRPSAIAAMISSLSPASRAIGACAFHS